MNKNSKPMKLLVLSPMFGSSRIYYSELLEAISSQAKKYGFGVMIHPVDVENKKQLSDYYHSLDEVEGIIAITCQVKESGWLEEALELGIPMVLLHDNIEDADLRGFSVVTSIKPDLSGLKKLMTHFIQDHGRKNMCLVMVPPKNHSLRTHKLIEVTKSIESNKLEFDEKKQLFFVDEYSINEGRRVCRKILDVNPSVDGIVCMADMTAIGVMQELKLMNEDQVLVAGFDNIKMSKDFDLTSVDQQLRLTGEEAIVRLNNAVKHENLSFQSTKIPTTLVKRKSCCKPRIPEPISDHPMPRFAIYYNVSDKKVLEAIDRMRVKIYRGDKTIKEPMTVKLLGKAPLYPLHVTLKGIFQIKDKNLINDMVVEIKNLVRKLSKFEAEMVDLMNYPLPDFLSFGFDENGEKEFRKLQKGLLEVVNKFRIEDNVEPEFRRHLFSSDEKIKSYTLKYGEPFVLDRFKPHATIVSGVENEEGYKRLVGLIGDDYKGMLPIKLKVDEIAVLYESTLGGRWKVLEKIHIGS